MSQLPPLLSAESVHDRRHLAIWLSLTFSAGAVNATALAACQRFVTHVTGTLTRVGADFGELWLMIDYACVFACFIVGAMTSVFLIDGRRMRNREPWPTAPLWLVSIVLGITSLAGHLDAFGPFGRTVETTGDFVLLSLLGFAMGLQNASVATTTGMIVRTTHMTGPVTDFSVALATSLSGGPAPLVAAARRSVWLRGSKIFSFLVGALVTSLIAGHLEYLTFLLPTAVTALAAVLLGSSLREPREAHAQPASIPAPAPSP